MAQGDVVAAAQAQALDIPALEIGPVRCGVGRICCQLKPGGIIRVRPDGECHVSPRIKEPVFTLPSGERLVVTTRRNVTRPEGVEGVLFRDDTGALTWQSHIEIETLEATAAVRGWSDVIRDRAAEWERRLFFRAEQPNDDGSVDPGKEGLRPAQVGALHAIGAHWSLYRHPATVVMPTGTGKTETMLATLAGFVRRGPLLVTVPSAILRDQTAVKFRTFGLLRSLGVLTDDAPNPIVAVVTRRPRSIEDLELFERCNVIVGTMSALAEGDAVPYTQEIAARVETLIVDEAHHIGADKWSQFREAFAERRILQFTATPFRRDGKLVDGTVVYNYPLKKAQQDGYFKPIAFVPVHESGSSADRAIAETAIERLQNDLGAGFNHLMMARCVSINRAKAVHAIYCDLAPDLNPVLIHSSLSATDDRLTALRRGDHRIAVCVNMLGEGFGLPELKVAAVHDLHKSLAILLQFTGRFTRSSADNIGDATIVANIADANVSDALERLYGEDADWNEVLSELSSEAARQHAELIEFLDSTERLDTRDDEDVAISHHLLRPTLSTLMYRAGDFRPKRFHEGLPPRMIPHRVWLHSASDTLFFVTRAEPALKWTRAKDVRNREWDLFILLYLALGITCQGEKEVLGLWIEQTEGAKFWLRVMNELKTRGTGDILIAVVDGLTGFPDAIATVFPQTAVQTCIVHLIRNSLAFVSWKDRKKVMPDPPGAGREREEARGVHETRRAAHAVLGALLDKYADEGVLNIDDANVLRIPPLDSLGTPLELVRTFGGKAGFEQAVHDLQSALYKEAS